MSQKLILGLDIGTSSVRAALCDLKGNMLPETFVKNERSLTSTDDGGAEIDAEVAFKQIVRAIDDVLVQSSDVEGVITHVAMCAFWHSLVGVDVRGRATTRVFGWADTRSREQTDVLRRKLDEAETHDRTGARFHSSFWPAKLLWLKKEFPDLFAHTSRWLSLSDFIASRLFGTFVTSTSMASGTGLYNIRECVWDPVLQKFLKIKSSSLPEISNSDAETFRLITKYSKRWPRLSNAEWFPAIGDGAANNIGAGCVKKSKAALMIGTSGAMRVAYRGTPPEKIPSGLWCYRIDRKRVIMGGALSDGGGLYRWLKQTLRLGDDDDRIEAEIAKRDPAVHGLTVLPFFAGERSTGYNEGATGAILGTRSATDAIDIVQAALESVAYRFAEIFDQLNSVCSTKELIASGGALRESPVWTQMIADVIGRNMTLPDSHEASMRGAVLLALESTGKIKKIEDVPTPSGKKFSAQKSLKAVYSAARKRHQDAYRSLIDLQK
ncbi:MAG: gluconokinase [Acidobacteriota bacterium]